MGRLGAYVTVLRRPGVLPPAIGTALASMPIGMLGLAILLLVQERGGIAVAGAVVAFFGIGTGLGIFAQGRLIDNVGPRPVLLVVASAQVALLASMVLFAGGSPWLVGGLAFAAGLTEPQVGGALRAMWPALVADEQRPVASALSSILFELPVMLGPLMLALLVRVGTVHVVILTAAGLAFVGALTVATSRASRSWRAVPDRRRSVLGPLAIAEVRLIASAMAAQGMAIGLLQVSCAAFFTDRAAPGDAGLLYALLTLGSLVGTTVYGAWARPVPHRRQLPALLLGLATALAGAASAPGVTVLAGWVFAAGLLVGPIAVRCFTDAERHTPPGSLAAASTTLIAISLAGTASGTATAGWLIDLSGTTAALLTAATPVLVAAAALVLVRR